jgi:signal peptidase I
MATLLIQSLVLFGVNKLFKIEGVTYKKAFLIILWSFLAQVGTVLFFATIGLAVLAPLFGLIVAVTIFCLSIRRYHILSWGKAFGIYFTNLGFNLVGGLILGLILALPIRLFLVEPFVVNGPSMSPHYSTGDYLIIEKFNTDFQKDDVVIYKANSNLISGTFFIKRIIGLPGDHLVLKDGVLTVNNIKINDPYLVGQLNGSNDLTLGSDEYFLLGDNLTQSLDSRMIGPIKKSEISGKVVINFGII